MKDELFEKKTLREALEPFVRLAEKYQQHNRDEKLKRGEPP